MVGGAPQAVPLSLTMSNAALSNLLDSLTHPRNKALERIFQRQHFRTRLDFHRLGDHNRFGVLLDIHFLPRVRLPLLCPSSLTVQTTPMIPAKSMQSGKLQYHTPGRPELRSDTRASDRNSPFTVTTRPGVPYT